MNDTAKMARRYNALRMGEMAVTTGDDAQIAELTMAELKREPADVRARIALALQNRRGPAFEGR